MLILEYLKISQGTFTRNLYKSRVVGGVSNINIILMKMSRDVNFKIALVIVMKYIKVLLRVFLKYAFYRLNLGRSLSLFTLVSKAYVLWFYFRVI